MCWYIMGIPIAIHKLFRSISSPPSWHQFWAIIKSADLRWRRLMTLCAHTRHHYTDQWAICMNPCICDTDDQDMEQAAVEAKACRAEEATVAELFGYRFHIKSHAVGRLQPKQQQRYLQCPGFWSSCCSWLASSCPESLGLWAWACQINPWSGSEGNSSPADEPCVYVCACSSCKFRLPWSEQDVFGTSTGPETCLGRSL